MSQQLWLTFANITCHIDRFAPVMYKHNVMSVTVDQNRAEDLSSA